MFESLLSFLLASTLNLGSGFGPNQIDIFDDKSLLSVSSIPVQSQEWTAPAPTSAVAVLVIDLDSQTVLFERNASERLPIASLTKLMTATIILEENDPNDIVTVSQESADEIGSQMNLYAGETITVRNLLYGLLIESGNDAAVALAEYNAGSEAAFIDKMNQSAVNFGMMDSHYANTTGLDSQSAYSSAHDLALLSTRLLQDEGVRDIVKNSKWEATGQDGTKHELLNTNILLGQMGIKGLKTGKTPLAGECLISLANTPDGHEVLTVVLGSRNRFADTKILLDWIYKAYTW